MSPKGRRWLLASLAVTGAIAALLVIAPLLLDRERYRSLLAERASRHLNRQVAAESLRIRLLPSPGASILGVTIADRAPWSGPFIETERLDVNLKLLPLLRGDLQVRQIRINRPRIRLRQGPDGWNIADLVRPTPRQPSADQRRVQGATPTREQPVLPILLAGTLSIREGVLVVERRPHDTGSTGLEIRNLKLDAGAPAPSTPPRIDLSGTLPGEASGSFALSCQVRLDDADRLPLEAHLKIRDAEAASLASSLGLAALSEGALTGTVDLDVQAAGTWPRLDLEANADLARLAVGAGERPGKAPGERATLHAKGRWDGDTLDVPEASLRWKEQTINGRLNVATLASPKIRFDLDAPLLDIDPLLAMATSNTSDGETTRTPRRDRDRRTRRSDDSDRDSRPGGTQVEGRLRSGAVQWRGLVLTRAEGELRYARGLLAIRRLRGGFYGGVLSGDAALALREREPRTSITAHLEGVQVEPLLKALRGEQWKFSGTMTLDSRLEFVGPPTADLLERAVGHSDLVVTGGRVTGYPPLDKVTQTFSPLLKEVGVSSALNEFDRLTAHWTLNRGTLATRDLLLQRAGAQLSAAGSMTLPRQTLDFDVRARVAKATLEAKVSGTPTDPVVTANVGRIERRIKTEVGKALKDERGKALGNMLRELLAR